MIYDSVNELYRYKGLYSNLDKAIDFIMTTNVDSLRIGLTNIDDDKVYVNVIESSLFNEDEGYYEFHKEYLDLHIDIVGKEKILLSNMSELDITKGYSKEGDYGLGIAKPTAECLIGNNYFCICMIDEPHMPCVKSGQEDKIKKAIFKIRV